MSCTAHKILKSISQMNLGDVTDLKKKGKKRINKEGKKLNKNKKQKQKQKQKIKGEEQLPNLTCYLR